jgi:hypothetical protein
VRKWNTALVEAVDAHCMFSRAGSKVAVVEHIPVRV